jgi:hypothetical protein
VNQNAEVSLRLAASPKDILAEGAEPLIKQLFRGISFDVKLNIWRKVSDVIFKVIETGELDAAVMPIFMGVAPAFLLKVKGSIDIDVDEEMQAKLYENPMVEPVLMDALTLVHAVGGCSSDDEFDQHLEANLPPPFGQLVQTVVEHLGNQISFSVVQPKLGVAGRINGEDLSLLVKNLVKLVK